MEIYIIPFILCLALAAIPFLIQLLVCMTTGNCLVRLAPMALSAACCFAYFLPYLSRGDAIGNAFEWVLLLCMGAALIIAHGVPFLIVGGKSKHSANKPGGFLTNPPVDAIMAAK